jgi:hypothetical protein
VRRRAEASEQDLDAGLQFLLQELRKLSQSYPEQAERLRIPASVDALEGRVRAATAGAPSPTDLRGTADVEGVTARGE